MTSTPPRWDPSFFHAHPLFWPIARAAAALEGHRDWPEPDDLTRLFGPEPPVRFERAAPRPRRGGRGGSPDDARYDTRIAVARRVPTRARSWHDLANALVWITFPRAKLALHRRQHAMIAANAAGGCDRRMPGARTREQDAVAMLDEGGVALLCARGHRAAVASALARPHAPRERPERDEGAIASLVSRGVLRAAVFGHGIYEGLAIGGLQSVRASGYLVEVDADAVVPGDRDDRDQLARADAALASLLAREAPIGRDDFSPVDLP